MTSLPQSDLKLEKPLIIADHIIPGQELTILVPIYVPERPLLYSYNIAFQLQGGDGLAFGEDLMCEVQIELNSQQSIEFYTSHLYEAATVLSEKGFGEFEKCVQVLDRFKGNKDKAQRELTQQMLASSLAGSWEFQAQREVRPGIWNERVIGISY